LSVFAYTDLMQAIWVLYQHYIGVVQSLYC